jgi:TRAP-type C4-dicarboxylate transport system substrate-binding protein
MKNRTSTKDGNLWARLTKEEQDELLAAFDESQDEKNLKGQDDMMKKHKKWL